MNQTSAPDDLADAAPVQRPDTVLVVDDSRMQRQILSSYLRQWGFRVVEAGSGEAALAICQFDRPDIVVSDWMMPGMNGLEFCEAFRAGEADRYTYFILTTARARKHEVVMGLDMGADDFIIKPINGKEFGARIRAGQRLVKMQRELTEKNQLIERTLTKMRGLYDALDRDLDEARRLQQSLVRQRQRRYGPAEIGLLLHPAGHIGGDLVGAFAAGDREVGFYAIDVSGHGMAAALVTAQVAAYFAGTTPAQNIALAQWRGARVQIRPPAEVAAHLNRLMLEDMVTEHYLTMLFAKANLETGEVLLTQAGHPHPFVQRADGRVTQIGAGGLPIGLIEGAQYDQISVQLAPGDRLLLGSDGITECADSTGEMLQDEGFGAFLGGQAQNPGMAVLDGLLSTLRARRGGEEFADDISAVMFDYSPEARSA